MKRTLPQAAPLLDVVTKDAPPPRQASPEPSLEPSEEILSQPPEPPKPAEPRQVEAVEVPAKAEPPRPQPLDLPEDTPQPSEATLPAEPVEPADPGWGAMDPNYQKALKEMLAQCRTEEERLRFMVSMATERTRPRKPRNTEPSNLELQWGALLSPKDAQRAKRPSLTEEAKEVEAEEKAEKVEQPQAQPKPTGPQKKDPSEKRETTLTRRAFAGGLASFLQRCRPDLMAAPAPSTSPAPEAAGTMLAEAAATASTAVPASLSASSVSAPLALPPAGAPSKPALPASSGPPVPLPPPSGPPVAAKAIEAQAPQPMLQRAASA